MKKLLTGLLSMGFVSVALAASRWMRPDASDWTVPESYWGNAVPNAGDVVYIDGNGSCTIESGTPSWDKFQSLDCVMFNASSSRLVISVPSGTFVTNKVAIGNSGTSPVYDRGTLIVRGGGTLVMYNPNRWVHDGVNCAFLSRDLRVEEGELRLPQDGDRQYRLGNTYVAAGAKLVLPRRAADKFEDFDLATCYLGGLSGAGTVTNASPFGVPLVFDRPFTNSFAGAIGGGVRLTIDDSGVDFSLARGANSFRASNGTGTLSLVGEIPGVLGIGGDSSFSGDIEVLGGSMAMSADCRYFKWVCMQDYGAETGAANYYGIYLEEFGLFDEHGQRVNIGLVQSALTDAVGRGEAAFVECGDSRGYDGYDTEGGTTIARIFNGVVDAENTMIMPRAQIELSNEKSYVKLLMHLTNGTPCVASYDFSIGAPGEAFYGYHPSRWKMLGSFDGFTWTEIDNRYDAQQRPVYPNCINCWNQPDVNGTFVSCVNVSHDTGYALNLPWTSALANVRKLRVAAGATLVADGEATISSLVIAAVDAGSLSGFRFADSGSLEIVNLPRGSHPVELPGTYGSDAELLKLRNWTVTVNGKSLDPEFILVNGGKISISGKGLVMLVK